MKALMQGSRDFTSMMQNGGGADDRIVQRLNPPAGFPVVPQYTLTRINGAVSTLFDITSKIPPVSNIWYVDPTSGNDGTAVVNDRSKPLLNLATALAKVDVDQVRIINLTSDFLARTTKSWNNVQPTRSVSVIVEGSFRYVSIAAASATMPTWAVNGTFGNVYSTVIVSASAAGVIDLKTRLMVSPLSVPTAYLVLKKVASLAAVAAEAGTWFHDGTSLHVRAHDDRNLVGDVLMQPVTANNNGRFPSVANLAIYLDGIDFVGGGRPWYSLVASAVTGTVLAARNCSFQGGSNANGLNIAAKQDVYLYRCLASGNWNDGFNYHSNESDGTTAGTSPTFFENECVGWGNGVTGSAGTSDNATTSHDFCVGVRLNGHYVNSDDRVLAEANSASTWNIGCTIGAAVQVAAGKQNVSALDTSKVWLDSCTAVAGNNPRWSAETSAQLYHYNSGPVVNDAGSTGTVASYVP